MENISTFFWPDDLDILPRKTNKQTNKQTKNRNKKKKPGKYGFVDKIIDGIRVEVSTVSIKISTLGNSPAKSVGPWTPPYISIDVRDIVIFTTNSRWMVLYFTENRPLFILCLIFPKKKKKKKIVDLKLALPKFSGAGTGSKEGFVYKVARLGSVNFSLIPQYKSAASSPVHILKKFPITMKITMRKRALDRKLMGMHLELIIDHINIELSKMDLQTIIHTLLGIQNATSRSDLIKRKLDFLQQFAPKPQATPISQPEAASALSSTST